MILKTPNKERGDALQAYFEKESDGLDYWSTQAKEDTDQAYQRGDKGADHE